MSSVSANAKEHPETPKSRDPESNQLIARRARHRFTDALSVAPTISNTAFRVAYRLLSFMPARLDGTSYPAVSTLAAELACSRRTIQLSLRELEKDGWFT